MRLFTAIDIPAEIKQRLRELIDRLRPAAKLSWSPVDNLHITTKFIGECPEAKLQVVKEALAEVPKPHGFEISIRGLSWFADARNPRVLFAGVESEAALGELARATEAALTHLGIAAEERPFRPHLTLARRRNPVPIDALGHIVAGLSTQDFGSFRASAFILYLSAAGKYTKLQEFPFVSSLC